MIGEGGQSRPTGIRRLWASGTAMSGAKIPFPDTFDIDKLFYDDDEV